MVMDQIEARGVRDKRVLEVMRRVKRHLFVPDHLTTLHGGFNDRVIGIKR